MHSEIDKEINRKYTKKLYWHDTYLFEHTAKVIEHGVDLEKGYWIRVDETIFRPQGGGQPRDIGTINGFKVTRLEEMDPPSLSLDDSSYDLAVITHYLEGNPNLNVDDNVALCIDRDIRLLNSVLHTAGHIVAGQMRVGYGYKSQTAANHIPDQAKVEFKQDGSKFDQKALLKDVVNIISENKEISAEFQNVPSCYAAVDRASNTRCVTIEGLWTEPCSGTHVKTTGEVKNVDIRYVRWKGGKASVGYTAQHGIFSSEKNNDDLYKHEIKEVKEVKVFRPNIISSLKDNTLINKITTPNDIEIEFFYRKGKFEAEIEYPDGNKKTLSSDKIFVNRDNDPEKSVCLSQQKLNYQAEFIKCATEISLLFSGFIVITRFNNELSSSEEAQRELTIKK